MESVEKRRAKCRRYHWRHRDKERARCRQYDASRNGLQSRLKRTYNVTVEWFDAQLIRQNGCCAICGEQLRQPNIDHNHLTKQVRSLLCHRCNAMTGFIEKYGELIPKAIEYLKHWRHQ